MKIRRYFTRENNGTIHQVENKNDAKERVSMGLATEWWRTELDPEADRIAEIQRHKHNQSVTSK